MKLDEIIRQCGLEEQTPAGEPEREVTGAYASDLLSDVMANAGDGHLWITLQTHVNIVAVAVLRNISGIILVNGRVPEETTLAKAIEEEIPILSTPLPAFEIAGRLYEMGLRGN